MPSHSHQKALSLTRFGLHVEIMRRLINNQYLARSGDSHCTGLRDGAERQIREDGIWNTLEPQTSQRRSEETWPQTVWYINETDAVVRLITTRIDQFTNRYDT